MTERRIEHVYDCSEQVFWEQIFLDEGYNRGLYIDELRFEKYVVVQNERINEEVHRVVRAEPPVRQLPSALEKLVTAGLGYEERGVVDTAGHRYRLEVTPNSLASRLNISGELSTARLSDNSCRRTYVANVSARIFGLAGLIEKRLLDDIEKSYEKAARFTNRWIAEHHA